jgi:hypothetical protein
MKLSIFVIVATLASSFAAPIQQMHSRDDPMNQADVMRITDPEAEAAIHTHMAVARALRNMPDTSNRYEHDREAEAQVVHAITRHLNARQDPSDLSQDPYFAKLEVCLRFPQAAFCK